MNRGYHFATYNPDQLTGLAYAFVGNSPDYTSLLLPAEPVRRDTLTNEFRCGVTVDARRVSPGGSVVVRLTLHRAVAPFYQLSGTAGVTITKAVTPATASLTVVGGATSVKNQWTFNDTYIIGGSYYWLLEKIYTPNGMLDQAIVTVQGVADTDPNNAYPKFEYAGTANPTAITTSQMTRYTTDWPYISAEYV